MKANKLRNNEDELNIWQPATDMMSALMYILLLVVVLLGLYLTQIPEHTEIDPDLGDGYEEGGWYNDGGVSPSPTMYWVEDGDGGGGWASPPPTAVPTETPIPSPTPTVTPTYNPHTSFGGDHGGFDIGEGMKSAVYVMLVDAETERTIKEANVEFELYTLDGALQILNTYYPERVSFRSYSTTESGTFYLPEKLLGGEYELHEITEAAGYDAAPNQRFLLDDLYDWPDPYVVRVPVYPSRNVIRVQLNDQETGQPVSGGSFDVISVEDIITPDGTLRYHAGETVGTIECNEEGYGVSPEIYLGEYTVRQSVIPEYYASLTEDLTVTVNKKADIEPPINQVDCQRTKVILTLTDELYPAKPIANVNFTIESSKPGAELIEAVTDSAGRIVLDSLDKGVTYRITQASTTGNYRINPDVHTVEVTAAGRIDQEPQAEVKLHNRMLRVALGITDELSSVQVPDVSLSLYTEAGNLVTAWTTTGNALMLETLDVGTYYIIKGDDEENHYSFTVRDEAQVQTFNVHTTYVLQYVVLGAGIVIIIACAAFISSIIRKRRKNKST